MTSLLVVVLGGVCLAGGVASAEIWRTWRWRRQVRRGERLLARALRR